MDTKIKKEPLNREGFDIYVSPHHAFGTDAILLADFADAKRTDTAVDLGTGCGIIPFLMVRDGLLKSGIGVDISPEATELCEKSKSELMTEKLTFINSDLNRLSGKIKNGSCSLVTCNPPYKKAGAGIKNPDPVAAAARHEIFCTLEDVVRVASSLLQTKGRFCVCHRPERLSELMALMHRYGVEPKRLRLVCKTEKYEPWLVLVEGKKGMNTGLRIMPTLFVGEDGANSPEMLKIYGPYKEGR